MEDNKTQEMFEKALEVLEQGVWTCGLCGTETRSNKMPSLCTYRGILTQICDGCAFGINTNEPKP